MFSQGHLIWIGISAALIACGLVTCLRRRPPLRRFLTLCLALGVVSEIIKVFSVAVIVPMVDPAIVERGGELVLHWLPTGEYTPYLGMEHLPLELCSLNLLFIFLALVLEDGVWKHRLYALMFVTGTIGGLLGILLSSIAGDFDSTLAFFTSARAWQFFLFHSMIVTLSLYLGLCEESGLRFADWKNAVAALILLDVPTFYLNSVFSSAVYEHDEVVGVTHRINYFSSYVNPLGLVLTEKWQWLVYLILRLAMAVVLIILLYLAIPGRRKEVAGNGNG